VTEPTPFTAGNTPDAPRSDLPDLLQALASDLRGVGYTLEGVADLLGDSAYAALNRDQLIPALIATEAAAAGGPGTEALAAVVRFWLLAVPQAAEVLDAALPRTRAEGLVALGLAKITGSEVAAEADLRPYGWESGGNGGVEIWVASDLAAHQRPGVLRHDHVLGIGQASTTLVQATIRRLPKEHWTWAPAAASRPSISCSTADTSPPLTSRSAPSHSRVSTSCSTPKPWPLTRRGRKSG
jgi:hypothetical protein